MKVFKRVARDILILIGGLAAVGLYIFGIIKWCIYTYYHWYVNTTSYWTCSSNRNITQHSKYTLCNPYWSVNNFHWGLFFGIIVAIVVTILIGCFISYELDND